MYNKNNIQILSDLEHIVKRPTRYIENVSREGIYQLFKEVLDNSIDEHLAGYADTIKVYIDYEKNTITVDDNGRGIPVGIHKKTKKEVLTTIFIRAKSGGKFDSDSYRTSTGLHGEGLTIVNALSDQLKVWSKRKTKSYYQEFNKGKFKYKKVKRVKYIRGLKGTRIKFKPSLDIFDTFIYKQDVVSRLKELSFLCPNLTILYKDNEEKINISKNRKDFHPFAGLDLLHDKVIIDNDFMYLEFAWSNDKSKPWNIYVNTSPITGGSPFTYIKNTFVDYFNKYSNKDLKKEILNNLNIYAHFKLKDPKFQGQTKHKIYNKELKDKISNAVVPFLMSFTSDKNKSKVVDDLIEESLHRIKVKENLKNKNKIKKKLKGSRRTILPEKLVSAYMCTPDKRELYIVEGESAGGNAKAGRDTGFQEILPLRGKIPNVNNKNLNFILKNKELSSIITATGCSINDKKGDNIRIGKLILLMDADPDGKHITSLLLNFLKKYLRFLIKEGKVYVIESPLFIGNYKDKRVFGNTKEEIYKKLPKAIITRLKGHGEADVDDLKKYAMNPKTRNIVRII